MQRHVLVHPMEERLTDDVGRLLPAETSHGDEQNDGTEPHRNLRNTRAAKGVPSMMCGEAEQKTKGPAPAGGWCGLIRSGAN